MNSPLPSICRTRKKRPLTAAHTEPSLSTSQILDMRLAFETRQCRESTMNRFPSSAKATLNSMSLDVNHMQPLVSLMTGPGEFDLRRARDIPGKSSASSRVFRSRMDMPPAHGTHSRPKLSSQHWSTKSLTNSGSVFSVNRMNESPSYRTSPPPNVLIQA